MNEEEQKEKEIILQVKNLTVKYNNDICEWFAVNNVSFDLEKGKTLGVVGESGSGKSQTMLAIMKLLSYKAKVSGEAIFHNIDLLKLSDNEINKYRGDAITMAFQDPMTALNPYMTVEKQLIEPLVFHKGYSIQDAQKEALNMLNLVKIPDAKRRMSLYPYEFSGGMRQRVMISMALISKPQILIADELTTALDVTIQAQILKLIKELQNELGMSIIFITHDIGVLAQISDDIIVLYGGSVMEKTNIADLLDNPLHPYSKGLLNAVPDISKDVEFLNTIPGEIPTPQQMPKGCPFATRCDLACEQCFNEKPKSKIINNHIVNCLKL